MSERTWSDIGNEIRDDYLRDYGPENINFREVQWDLWVAAIEREAAARALEEAADEIFVQHAEFDPGKRMAFHRGADAVYDALRARAAEIRERGAE